MSEINTEKKGEDSTHDINEKPSEKKEVKDSQILNSEGHKEHLSDDRISANKYIYEKDEKMYVFLDLNSLQFLVNC